LKKQVELMLNPLDLSIDFGKSLPELLSSYIEALTRFRLARYIAISTLVSLATVVFTLMFAVPGAYAVARLRFPGRRALTASILIKYIFPPIVIVIPLYSVFSQLGLRDTLLGLLIVYPAGTLPVSLYMLYGYFRSLPAELEDAGQIDGCSRLGVILRITLPLSMPAIAAVALYIFMIAWNEFLFAFMFLDDPDIFTLSRGLVAMEAASVSREVLMAGAVLATLPVLVLFLWAERYMVSGLSAGGLKG
jgi:multiple sugar transport system permease protein